MKTLTPYVKAFALDFLRAIGTPLSARLASCVKAGEWDTIASCKVDPRDYTDAQEYFLDASAASLLRKYSDLPTSFDRAGVALENWRLGEVDCFKTNERLIPYLEGWTHPDFRPELGAFFEAVREKISNVLGRAPLYEELDPKHGPGATFSDKSVVSTVADKMNNSASITNTALWFLPDWLGTAWGREASKRGVCPVWVRGNRFTTAPKDATKDRPIAAEPSVNVFYQLGLGLAVRRRLKTKVGIDLTSGQAWHREIAALSSQYGKACTLDLKNASDTLAYNLVKLLLPPKWFSLFSELRSPFTRMDHDEIARVSGRPPVGTGDHWVKLEKFSSMGNGFTFELETLVFWAITDTVVDMCSSGPHEKTLAYGDDIICDSRYASAVTSALRFCGFTLNLEKSFVEGPFRESCGGDFWNGRPVRPMFLKEPLDEPQQVIAAANSVRRLGKDLFGGPSPLDRCWAALLDSLPSSVRRCRGPESLGDIVVHCDERWWGWTSSRKDRVWCYRPVRHRKVSYGHFAPGTVFACGLYGLDVSSGFINPRDSVTGYAVRKVLVLGIDWVPAPATPWSWPCEPSTDVRPRRGPDYSRAYRSSVAVALRRSTRES